MHKQARGNSLLLFMASCCLIVACVILSLFFMKTRTDNISLTTAKALTENIQLPNAEFVSGKTEGMMTDDQAEQFDAMSESEMDPNLLRQVDFDNLRSVNSDVRSWVYIPETNVDYYVMQEQTLGVYYYLWRDISKNSSTWGSILTPKIPLDADDAHTLIFGHRMKNTSQAFSSLSKYRDTEYAEQHKYVYQYFPDHAERWEVYAALNIQPADTVYEMPFELGSDDYQGMLDHVSDVAIWAKDGIKPDANTRTTMLSTCHDNDTRFVVVCVPDLVYYY